MYESFSTNVVHVVCVRELVCMSVYGSFNTNVHVLFGVFFSLDERTTKLQIVTKRGKRKEKKTTTTTNKQTKQHSRRRVIATSCPQPSSLPPPPPPPPHPKSSSDGESNITTADGHLAGKHQTHKTQRRSSPRAFRSSFSCICFCYSLFILWSDV